MNGPIAQAVALVCHANAALHGRAGSSFPPTHSTSQFCECITFTAPKRWWWRFGRAVVAAAEPSAWIVGLRQQGRTGVLLHHESAIPLASWLSPRMSAGLIGGGARWLLETVGDAGRSAMWTARWDVGNRDAPDRRIWRVNYHTIGNRRSTRAGDLPELAEVERRLMTALAGILDFARRQDCAAFADTFASALRMLETQSSTDAYHQDLAPTGTLPAAAAAILAACQAAWVFGGMGSWNDMAFAGNAQIEYERVSEALFAAVHAAIVAAANSTFDSARPVFAP